MKKTYDPKDFIFIVSRLVELVVFIIIIIIINVLLWCNPELEERERERKLEGENVIMENMM